MPAMIETTLRGWIDEFIALVWISKHLFLFYTLLLRWLADLNSSRGISGRLHRDHSHFDDSLGRHCDRTCGWRGRRRGAPVHHRRPARSCGGQRPCSRKRNRSCSPAVGHSAVAGAKAYLTAYFLRPMLSLTNWVFGDDTYSVLTQPNLWKW